VRGILSSSIESDLNETADLIEARATVHRRPVAGIGRVLLWSGGSLWIGRDAGRSDSHAHHAIQVALAMDSHFLMGTDLDDLRAYKGALVMPDRRHRFDGRGERTAMIFVEPETAQGRLLLERYGGGAITDLGPDTAEALVAPLRTAYVVTATNEVLIAISHDLVAALAGPVSSAHGIDPRITRAIAWVRGCLDRPVSLNSAAEVANLSPSRFRHLFVAQTGVSFRAYVLWARVEAAVGAAMGGLSWTAAAHEAGFADSAHLSRTCRRMFGFAPASIIAEHASPDQR
jgi:AraC-like DNA-binding protein